MKPNNFNFLLEIVKYLTLKDIELQGKRNFIEMLSNTMFL
jgi:hypothetical protein